MIAVTAICRTKQEKYAVMGIEIKMPALSPTMEEGTLAKWLVKEGDSVQSGDLLAEIETDKATMEFEAVDEGVIGKILVAEGTDNVKVGTVIAIIGEGGAAAARHQRPILCQRPPLPPLPLAPEPAPTPAAPLAAVTTPAVASRTSAEGARIAASPLARRMVEAAGLDIASLTGTGPNGRIVKADVEAAMTQNTLPPRLSWPRRLLHPRSGRDSRRYGPSAFTTDIPHSAEKLSATCARRSRAA
jgi:pyruvate dehydrogenase E2 component (dihydrolipoamide acetyltransferase)